MEKQPFERPFIKKLQSGMPSKFGMKMGFDPITEIDGLNVKDLIDEYGSPLYILSEKTIRKTLSTAKRAFTTRYPKVQFTWSYKTNYLDAVCSVYHQEGSWAEVVSGFEYDKAISNGVDGKFIIFNGPDKSAEDLEKAIQNDSLIHIDHFDEMYMLNELSDKLNKKPKVAIRVNMDTGIYPKWDRFGFNYENGEAWDAINRIMIGKKLDLVGLHTHIGTFLLAANPYKIAAGKLADLAVNIENKYNHNIKYIDMGGGFASRNTLKGAYLPGTDTVPDFDDYAEAITSFWYEHIIVPAQPFSHHTEETAIYGPLCMNIDVLRENIDFPLLKKNDHVVSYTKTAPFSWLWLFNKTEMPFFQGR